MRYRVTVLVDINARNPESARNFVVGRLETERENARNIKAHPAEIKETGPDVVDWAR